MVTSIRSIVHPTDFSEASMDAFAHALRIALLVKGKLDIVHVASEHDRDGDAMPPQVRHALSLWGLAKETDSPASVGERLNIKVSKVELPPQNAKSGILGYLRNHPSDLLVVATHGREGFTRWLRGSVAESVALRAHTLTLFLSADARNFVDEATGEIILKRVLVPVDHQPSPEATLGSIANFVSLFGKPDVEWRFVHAGNNPPALPKDAVPGTMAKVELRSGQPVDAILREAADWHADLIVMPTAGHHGLMDALAGSTSERVVRRAPCPVLTVPVHA
jgi:nucleotide-binding universal stress UspA family protein